MAKSLRQRATERRDRAPRTRCRERSSGRGTEPIVRALVEVAVSRVGEELAELLRQHEAVEDLGGLAQAALLRAAQLGELLVPDLPVEVRRRRPAVGELRRVPDPLPELRARDLRGRRVLNCRNNCTTEHTEPTEDQGSFDRAPANDPASETNSVCSVVRLLWRFLGVGGHEDEEGGAGVGAVRDAVLAAGG